MKRIFFIALFALVVISCKKSSNYTPDCSGPAKSYATDVAPLLSSCAGCHGSRYTGYSNASSQRNNIYSVIAAGTMPKGSSLSSTEKNAILCWINSGCPNN